MIVKEKIFCIYMVTMEGMIENKQNYKNFTTGILKSITFPRKIEFVGIKIGIISIMAHIIYECSFV